MKKLIKSAANTIVKSELLLLGFTMVGAISIPGIIAILTGNRYMLFAIFAGLLLAPFVIYFSGRK